MDNSYDPPARFENATDQLHELVSKQTGMTDFGPPDYLPGLRALLMSMDYDPQFTELGRRFAWGEVVNTLMGRAHAFAAMKANPGFDVHPIVAPVVITGVPRTGTTALHRLLAVDPRLQGLQTWLLDSPMPRPPRDTWERYPAFQKSVALIEARYEHAPQKRAAHHVAAGEIHECCMLLRQQFVSNILSCMFSSASYDAWWQSTSEETAYRYYRKCVALIGSSAPEKRWLLKNPGHIENLDLLFAVFPDAKVIQTHRDPAKAIPSLVSLLMQLAAVMEDPARRSLRGKIMLSREVAKWSNAVRRCQNVRETHHGQVLDIVHADFHANPLQVVERIYDFIGWDIPDDTRAALARRIAEQPERAHGVHRYSIADYGMTEDEARAPFADYIARFDLLEQRR
ncbi:MAG: sulfotransferase [Alphaproteobacteria bacterium]|nr:sulfotransferase [Alphaproteobacteria bacterium]MDE2042943.1 sulfotransferase [Alphaproteobacteria bacterium]MDE2340016.1 sulfotransferase [Alphaproteobacteria bacterium]